MSVGVNLQAIPNSERAYQILRIYDVENITVEGGNLIGERYQHTGTTGEWGYGISIQGGSNIVVNDLVSKDMWGDGINLQVLDADRDYPKNVIMNNVKCINNRRQGMSIEGGEFLRFNNCQFSLTNGIAPSCGVDIEPWSDSNIARDIVFDGCSFYDNSQAGLLIMVSSVSNVKVINSTFKDNTDIEGQLKMYSNIKDIFVSNNTFLNTNPNTNILGGVSAVNGENIIVSNNIFKGCFSKINKISTNTNKNIVFDNNFYTFKKTPYQGFFIPTGGGLVDLIFRNNRFIIEDTNTTGLGYTPNAMVSLSNLSPSSEISNNYIENHARGILIYTSNEVLFEKNTLVNQYISACVLSVNNSIIKNNTVKGACLRNTGSYAMDIIGNYNTVVYNQIIKAPPITTSLTGRAGFGIYLGNDSIYTIIENNIVDEAIGVKVRIPQDLSKNNYAKHNGVLVNEYSLARLNDVYVKDNIFYKCISSTKYDSNGVVTSNAVFERVAKPSVNVTDVSTTPPSPLSAQTVTTIEEAQTAINNLVTMVNALQANELELKEKLNAKLTADRNSGQQATT